MPKAKKTRAADATQVKCPFCSNSYPSIDIADHVTLMHPNGNAQPQPQAQPQTQAPPSTQQQGYKQRPGSIPPPQPRDESPFLNMQKLGGRTLQATILAVASPTEGRYGMGMNATIEVAGEGRFRLTIKVDSQNHQDLFAKFGANWTGHKIQISPAWTKRGSARMAVVPLQ